MLAKAPAHSSKEHESFEVKAVNSKEQRPLYKTREKIYPKRTRGNFRTFKWGVMLITLGIYYILPWIRFDRGPYAPDQAVLVDLANRRFYFFFIEVWPQEFFYIAGLLVMAGIGLFLVTSTIGRAWCGYTCPQTVWVDLFLMVERFFEGDRNARIKLDAAPINGIKIARRTGKHTVWLLIAIATGGAWIFYFADAPTLFMEVVTGKAPFAAYATIATLTATTYVFGGLAREQVCTYMCPWPRIQAAMLDEHSLTVTYNDWRGEKRARHQKREQEAGNPVGDCVDCNACIAVCPMGIDIRDGQQLECISCALCIDACNDVMDKLGLERGLISYTTLSDYNANMQMAGAMRLEKDGEYFWETSTIKKDMVRKDNGLLNTLFRKTDLSSFIRLRTLLYTTLYGGIGLAMLAVLILRDRLDITITPDRNPVFVKLADGSIRNTYALKIRNMKTEPRRFSVRIMGLGTVTSKIAGEDRIKGNTFFVDVEADKTRTLRVFLQKPAFEITAQQTSFQFMVNEIDGKERALQTAKFQAPADSVQAGANQ